ncbi:MAG TPA: hypothetical protein VJW20_20420 [Candidatus Angelobacter sp.]|nr:hypothetical protein [Candidatus Angelobacter sp.]
MTSQLIMAAVTGAFVYALLDYGRAKLFCWRRRRQAQRAAAEMRLKQQLAVKNLQDSSQATLDAYPFMIQPRNFKDGIAAAREIFVLLRSRDKRCFTATESEGEWN